MEKNLILTGWGYPEYVAAAAVALKALGGRADVMGISKRRLPEFIGSDAKKWENIYILGVSLYGDVPALAEGLKKLRSKGVKVMWITALPMDDFAKPDLEGLMDVRYYNGWLLEAVGRTFDVNVESLMVYADTPKKVSKDVQQYLTLIEAAQYNYRNYQDDSLFSTAVTCMANGIKPDCWAPNVKEQLEHYDRYGNRELIGKSVQMLDLQDRINRVAGHSKARVLIIGESGTGKETVANLLHNKSDLRKEPFIAFNCASVSKDLLEDRFFGHVKGGFTDAKENTKGLFEQADGGTLFLDEIGELSPEAQATLLRVLEGGRFQKVGSSQEVKVNVRLITATNRNLPVRVREGKFREDLFMRLNVVQLRVPSLREHKEDIPIIANAWWRKNHDNRVLDDDQLAALMEYDYPGNVRELINLLDRATALEEYDFEKLINEHKEMNAGLTDGACSESGLIPDEMEGAMRIHVRKVYDKYGQNLTKAADALKVSRNTVRKYL